MVRSILPDELQNSRLARWNKEDYRHRPTDSNIVRWESPDGVYKLSIKIDDPPPGFLIRLYAEKSEQPIGVTVVDDRDLALRVAVEMCAAAEDLDELQDLEDVE